MRTNPLRTKFEAHEPAIGCWLTSPSSVVAEVAARVGFDYVCIDMQHGLIDYSDVVPMLQALSLGDATATVRVPWNEPGIIGKVLDAGAMAVIVPMVNTPEQAAQALASGRYAPLGSRSTGPIRVMPLEGPDYHDSANEQCTIIPMIETVEAIDNLAGILSTPGVEVVYVGPADLAVSMGFGRDCVEPEFLAALDQVVTMCVEHGVVPAMHASPATVQDRLARGFRMVTVQTDLNAITANLGESLAVARS